MSTTANKLETNSWFTSMLAILFIGLKLGHVIDWSWWWVLSPLWIGPAVIVLAIAAFVVAIFVGGSITSSRKK